MNNSNSSLRPFDFSQSDSYSKGRYDSFLLVLIGTFIPMVYYQGLNFMANQPESYQVYERWQNFSMFISALGSGLVAWGCFTIGRSKFRFFALVVGTLEIVTFLHYLIRTYYHE